MKKALVCGAGGFIGCHMVEKLKTEGFWVRAVDLSPPRYSDSLADDFVIGDLRDPLLCQHVFDQAYDEVYQLAADMGGAGYVFVGMHDADIMHNSALINLNVLEAHRLSASRRIFFASSACVYPRGNQTDSEHPITTEESAYPADPDSEYGWEKLFSERLYLAYLRNHGVEVSIARFHNIFGPLGSWNDGREKAPAALCRKVAQAACSSSIEVWGDGSQTRSFLYIDECIEATRRLLRSGWNGPVNIGSEASISINQLASRIIDISGKSLEIRNVEGPVGVRGRTSDNRLFERKLGHSIDDHLQQGLIATYAWIKGQIEG
jgi:nucleoside-diphosphate-sugar epimerase